MAYPNHQLSFLSLPLFLLFYLFGQATIAFGLSYQDIPEPPPPDSARVCPLPKCKTCPTARQIHAPGVGMALEMGYGTAVTRFHDHSYQDVAYTEGQPSYLALTQRLATGPRNRIPHDIPSNWEKLRYLKKRSQRILNKALGRPANPETAILADMAAKLKSQIEGALGEGERLTAAILSSPDRIRLTTEEITDVFDYLNIKNLMAQPDDLEHLYATSAAYAGFGLGLCRRYTDPYVCEREELHFTTQRLLHLDYTPGSLSGTIQSLKSARESSADETFINTDLGLGRLDSCPEGEAFYWGAVRDRIRLLVQSFKPRITQLILTGSSAGDGRFKEEVKEALYDLVPATALDNLRAESTIFGQGSREVTVNDFIYATAKGAAEFAKRRQEGPVRCAESEKCKLLRKGIEQDETTEKLEM